MKFASSCWILTLLAFFTSACTQSREEPEKQSGAAEGLEWWGLLRSYPSGKIYSGRFYRSFLEKQQAPRLRDELPSWTSLGPTNIGGRTLCLAFHPDDPDIIFAGSASGGLWKTTTAGMGADAWERIPTGFPVLGVASIAIDPENPDLLYIGTGEVYNYEAARPGVVSRFTRGTYGIGILRSTDGGRSWALSLDWTDTELRGIWDIVINPINRNTLYAATTLGVLTSKDGGRSWQNIHPKAMAMDLELHPTDTSILFVSHGSFRSPDVGVYRSRDAGQSFELLEKLEPIYDGKTMIAISPSDPDILYASMARVTTSVGLWRSLDGGDNWKYLNPTNVARWQGWYAHDVTVHPTDPNSITYAGIDAHQSEDGGVSLTKVSDWEASELGITPPPGGPEGPPNYVHADIHAAYYQPGNPQTIFLATDGGVFVSEDEGQSWEGRNGGYQTTQFYADFANSTSNGQLAVGGLQDNGTIMYSGEKAWRKIGGGDGMSAAIDPEDDHILYISSQFLNLRRSDDGGNEFQSISIAGTAPHQMAFSAPYRLAPSLPSRLYAGTDQLYRSDNRGSTWRSTNTNPVDKGNPILTIAVATDDPNWIYVSTAPRENERPKVLRSRNGGESWEVMTGLPDRIASDIVFSPANSDTAYITFSGFGMPHLYRTGDGGRSWAPIGISLPDVPANTLAIDPLNPSHLYLGNDLGVYASFDGGATWRPHDHLLAEAALVMHLSISPDNRKLRAATHGLGAFETDLLTPGTTPPPLTDQLEFQLFPNPVAGPLELVVRTPASARFSFRLFNAAGQLVRQLENRRLIGKTYRRSFDLHFLPAGVYFYEITGVREDRAETFTYSGRLVKN